MKNKKMYHPFIVGKRIYLRGIEKEDLKGNLFQWANDSQVTYYLFMGTFPNHIELLEEQYEKSIRDNTEVQFIIADKKNNKVIGFCGVYRIEWIGRSCEYRIFIGEKDYWGKRIGSEVAGLLLEYAFDKLNMNKIWLGVNAEHIAGVKSYEKAGFVREGILRQEIYRNGKYYDVIRMSILREEFYKDIKPKLKKKVFKIKK